MLFVLAGAINLIARREAQIVEMPPWAFSALAVPNGEAAARRDLQNGVKKVVLYGLIVGEEQINKRLSSFGYSWSPGGCVIGGNEYDFWNAYNRVMIEAGREQYGDRFMTAMSEDLI